MVESNLRLPGERFYRFHDRLQVNSGATLTIEPGTAVLAHSPAAEIVVGPGSRIRAPGLREAPVVLTYSAPFAESDWLHADRRCDELDDYELDRALAILC